MRHSGPGQVHSKHHIYAKLLPSKMENRIFGTICMQIHSTNSIMGTKDVYNCTNMIVDMGLDKNLHNDREPCNARIFNAWIKYW